MAGSGNVRRSNTTRRNAGIRTEYIYVDGTAARRLNPRQQSGPVRVQNTHPETVMNRERALQMNFGYVLFLTAAAIITVFMCVNYLQLQAKSTKLRREVTSLESTLDAMRLENDLDYDRIVTGIDMEHVKDVAMNSLGMVYAGKNQVVTYTRTDGDYVRQYDRIP